MKRKGAPGDPVGGLDLLRWKLAAERNGKASTEQVERVRYQLENGPPTATEYADRTWPTDDQMADLLEALEADVRGADAR